MSTILEPTTVQPSTSPTQRLRASQSIRLIQRTETVSEDTIEYEYEYRDAEYEYETNTASCNVSVERIAAVSPPERNRGLQRLGLLSHRKPHAGASACATGQRISGGRPVRRRKRATPRWTSGTGSGPQAMLGPPRTPAPGRNC